MINVITFLIIFLQVFLRSNPAGVPVEILMHLPPVSPLVLVKNDPGGSTYSYIDRIREYVVHGSHVEIRGYCASACTLLLQMKNVCADKHTIFAFHQASNALTHEVDVLATNIIFAMYPYAIKKWIIEHGGLKPEVIYLWGKDMRKLVTTCPSHKS